MYLRKVEINSDGFPTQRCYPFNIPIIGEPVELTLTRPITFFVGENGSGKSTVLDAIARKCGVQPWHKPRRHLAHNNPYETRLTDYITTTWANGRVPVSLFRAETFHDFADFLDDVALCDPGRLQYHGGRILNTLSHGQGILSYFSGRFQVKGLYFLDEPETALSPRTQLRLRDLLQETALREHAQFVIATHSPILLSVPCARLLSFDRSPIREIAYRETDHFKVYRDFMRGEDIAGPGALE